LERVIQHYQEWLNKRRLIPNEIDEEVMSLLQETSQSDTAVPSHPDAAVVYLLK
jgi:hypothetical protein